MTSTKSPWTPRLRNSPRSSACCTRPREGMSIPTNKYGFTKQAPIFYPGDELHRIKQQKVQLALEQSDFDAFLFFKAEAVRYITDFYVKGFRPFMEPEYVVLVA